MTATATHAKTRMLLLTALFAALTAIGAFLKIPTPWSSFTLQVFFVCMAGVLLGPKYGALSQLVYIALGLMGLPIFTAGGGLGYVFQPTFGFLLSYIPAAFVIGLKKCFAPAHRPGLRGGPGGDLSGGSALYGADS